MDRTNVAVSRHRPSNFQIGRAFNALLESLRRLVPGSSAAPEEEELAAPQVYRFESWRLDLSTRELANGEATKLLESRVFGLLVYLIENRDRIVSRAELLENVWDLEHVTPNSLNAAIARTRKALEEPRGERRFIATIYGEGYRFISQVEKIRGRDAEVGTLA